MFFRIMNLVVVVSFLFLGCGSGEKKEAQKQAAMPNPHAVHGAKLLYTAPQEWVSEKPASSMRKAQYRLPGVEGAEDATLAVFNFPGTGGTVEANLNRWYGQFVQPGGSETKSHAVEKKEKVNGLSVTEVYVTGTYLQSSSGMMMGGDVKQHPNWAMMAAIVETPGSPWFFKATGPKVTIDHWKDAFHKFTQTFRMENQ